MKIQFLGASKIVTGSNILITTGNNKILIDCGMFQGSEELEQLNNEPFEFDPKEIDYLFLSHAHIDHSGRIPKLVKEGFKGKIYCTKATKELAEIMLVDSGHIQESDVTWENRKRKRSGKPPLEPLYTVEDARNSLRYFESALYNQKLYINPSISIRFRDAGHILGSSIIEIWITENKNQTVKIVFSGDLGSKDKPIIKNFEYIEDADYLIMESTYGNRLHESKEQRVEKLISIINETVLKGGSVIIPSFAVGRTQELIYELNKYYEYNQDIEMFLRVPIYIDSPMAIAATEVFKNNSYCFNEETKNLILSGDNPLVFENLHYVRSHEESMRLNEVNFPKVVISASGMCTAGRIRHHLKHNLWKANNSVVFVGYQANGTLGRILKDGAKKVKLLGEEIAVLANIYSIEGFSGHADQQELLDWLSGFKKMPSRVFLVHGEEESTTTLSKLIEEKYKTKTIIPNMGYTFQIEDEVLKSYSGELLEPVERKENIKKELQQVYDQFESLVDKTDRIIDEKILNKEYDSIKNKLLQLQKELLDLNIHLGE
ncbi:MBL fold metallo-hydrolase RNA specificity domain-containing protein [Serpentinicella alkaliphila]|uniref:Metallo-beta-lactamase family protein n=1 Tax=Serpentinicella alkaliphila TaxID=1734049 RepID=A0A4R2TJU1_9FIRM|nr:MBL fold metallo-hydrolase [Serpentinicella alkaliphila]QUH24621.1 MBL fold metallo-hydrolase [Serpentinicella alkaliphila]TCQ02622.1 metallo-beta-lactamase family protein [Serpentinicella alkaliphila]